MTKFPHFTHRAALLALAGGLASTASGQYGGLDATFTPTTNGAITSLVQVADGGIVVTGAFTQIKDLPTSSYETLYRVAKFSSGGVLDESYAPNFNQAVYNAAAEPDGKVLYAGLFSAANITGTPVARAQAARLLDDGDVDPNFVSAWNGLSSVNSLVRHLGGYLLLADAGCMRIGINGSNDTAFEPYYLRGAVGSATVQTDGRFLINGPFGLPGVGGSGVNSLYLERLSQNGTAASPAFSHAVSAQVYCSAIQADGKILVGGQFGGSDGYPIVGITRLLSTGAPDPDFLDKHRIRVDEGGRPFIDGAVRSIAIQADGKFLIAGDFVNIRLPTKLNGVWEYAERRGVARLNADGSLDATFNAGITGANFIVYGVTIQSDGRILINGEFQIVGGSSRPLAARLINYSATQALSYDGTILRWDRGGSSPDAQSVFLEYRASSSSTWNPVDSNGIAVREGTTGNWIRPTTTIPANSYIRATARTSAGQFNGSTGIASATIAYLVPDIAVRRDPSTPLTSGGSTNFGSVGVTRPRDFSFTITNNGTGTLTGLSATINSGGTNFSIVTAPASSLTAGSSTPVVVRFDPTSTGNKTGNLRINSNDPDTPQFNVSLSGTGVTDIEGFRYEYFTTTSNTGNAADGADPDGDGQTNFFEFVAGLIPNDKNSKFIQNVDRSSGVPQVVFSPIVAGRTYEVWTTTTLANDWALATGTNVDSGQTRTFTHTGITDPKRFYQIRIIRP